MEKRFEVIGWLDDQYGKWTVFAETAEQAQAQLQGAHPDQKLVVMAIMSTM